MSKQFKCPECGAICDHFKVYGGYDEQGSCSGTRSLEDEYEEWENQNCNDSSYEVDKYECAECEYEFDYEFVEAAEESSLEIYEVGKIEIIEEITVEIEMEEQGKIEMGNINPLINKHEPEVTVTTCIGCGLEQERTSNEQICYNCESELI